ncbi:MAG: class II fructose-1,6-bisphosphate aldolase [Firmicutes bacterium]|nr:class II fructose-1,6-bisphosphate aldolase [Bacillota bacterium]MCL1953919.1 class II fructose-1,6-bisphosphate aldolase [Bacillota bacterium]
MPLVNTKKMFKAAYDGHFAVGAFNINNLELLQAIVDAAKEEQSPIILQASLSAIKYAKINYLKKLVDAAVEDSGLPIALHLDHGDSFESCKMAVDAGFTSVMIDASHHSFEENILISKKVADYAHQYNVTVEAELGRLAGVEDEVNVSAEDSSYTRPEEVEEFVKKTGVDSLAIAIGTSHGAFKFKGEPKLRFDILEECEKRIRNFPIVLHGASNIPQQFVEMLVENGGSMSDAKGIPDELLRKAVSLAVCKVNIDSDLRLVFTSAVRKHFKTNPSHFDPRQYLGAGREQLKQFVKEKLKNALGSSGHAKDCM